MSYDWNAPLIDMIGTVQCFVSNGIYLTSIIDTHIVGVYWPGDMGELYMEHVEKNI